MRTIISVLLSVWQKIVGLLVAGTQETKQETKQECRINMGKWHQVRFYLPILRMEISRSVRWVAPGYLEELLSDDRVALLSVKQLEKQLIAAKVDPKVAWKQARETYRSVAPLLMDEDTQLESLALYLQAARVKNSLGAKVMRRLMTLQEREFLCKDVKKYHACRVALAEGAGANWRQFITGTARPTGWDNKQIDKITAQFTIDKDLPTTFRVVKSINRLNRPLTKTEWNWAVEVLCERKEVSRALVRDWKEISRARKYCKSLGRNPENLRGIALTVLDEVQHTGTAAGLENILQRSVERWRKPRPNADPNTELAKPPFVPDHPCIRFVSTVGELIEEGERMKHCVAAYSRAAIAGERHFFHVDLDGEEATVMVNKDLAVVEVRGRYNSHNAACVWAAEFFTEAYGRQ